MLTQFTSTKRLVRDAKQLLDVDEPSLAVVRGLFSEEYDGIPWRRYSILIATDRRLIVYGKKISGHWVKFYSYEKITSLKMVRELVGPAIWFTMGSRWFAMRGIYRGNAAKVVSCVRMQVPNSLPESI